VPPCGRRVRIELPPLLRAMQIPFRVMAPQKVRSRPVPAQPFDQDAYASEDAGAPAVSDAAEMAGNGPL